MSDDFQKTVDLREKMERERKIKQTQLQRSAGKKYKSSAEDIDNVYGEGADEPRNNLRKINRPVSRDINEPLIKKVLFIVVMLLVAAALYWMFFARADQNNIGKENEAQLNWYAVKLINGEVYYGQINDTSADPVVIENVYYNYDQFNEEDAEKPKSEVGNLRLVKRGQETHGPAGSMNIVRAQVVYMESLKEDSKVLKAILDYEK